MLLSFNKKLEATKKKKRGREREGYEKIWLDA